MTLGKEEGERNIRKVGKWRKKERKHKWEKGKTKTERKNEKGKEAMIFRGGK